MNRCSRCDSGRVLFLGGKSTDLNNWTYQGWEGHGYVPHISGIGGGDYYSIAACLECGQLQGQWPQPTPEELTPAEVGGCDPGRGRISVEIDLAAETKDVFDDFQTEAEERGCELCLIRWQGPGGGWPQCELAGPRDAVRSLLISWGFEDQVMDLDAGDGLE